MSGYSIVLQIVMIAAAVILDILLGDPRALPHPVIWMGKAIVKRSRFCVRIVSRMCKDSFAPDV